jgi:hypothetical protein
MKPKLVIIFWPHAVGKMTVGQELAKITWLNLFHNHMTIDLVVPLFGYWSESPIGTKLVNSFREQIMQEFAQSNMEGLIFTCIRYFDDQNDRDYITSRCKIFEDQWWETYFVELEANIDTRIKRNITPNRLEHKPSKRNIERSQNDLKKWTQNHRLNSHDWEITKKNYIKIDNTNLTPEQVATQIKINFKL